MSQFTVDDVRKALNQAADDVIDAGDFDETGAIDVANLVVNAAISYLEGSASNLVEVIEQNYGFQGSALPCDCVEINVARLEHRAR